MSEVNYVNSFFNNFLKTNLYFKSSDFDFSIPTSVIFISNIKANNYDDAEKYALKKAEILNIEINKKNC